MRPMTVTPIVDPLEALAAIVEEDVFLSLAVMELSNEEGTLVALATHDVPAAFIRRALERHWDGPVEVYHPMALFAGSGVPLAG